MEAERKMDKEYRFFKRDVEHELKRINRHMNALLMSSVRLNKQFMKKKKNDKLKKLRRNLSFKLITLEGAISDLKAFIESVKEEFNDYEKEAVRE